MKILAFVDLHSSLKALKEIKNKVKNVDLIICAGDISIFEQKIEYLLEQLDKLNKPILIIPGNHETAEDIKAASLVFKNIIDLHKKVHKKGDHLFLGYGEGGFSMVDKEFEKIAKKFEKEIKKQEHKNSKIILITHGPPYKTKLDNLDGHSCGNKSVKNFIKKVKPDLAISGHLHENSGKEDKIGKTRLINPGPKGKIINI
jgi:Icc-related predicted phosphoesterase